ncbi:MAG: glycoside hydrolase family 130 protein [Kiritimatiellaeota bacterium]|nr:glycoside hydrolase family 130 protein [Kiritimatiellota bacterium]
MRPTAVIAALVLVVSACSAEEPARAALPPWALGPFVRPAEAQPVIRPNPDSVFDCPMKKAPVKWEARHTFNPAAVVKDGKIHVLYRAEDNSSGGGIGRFTSRIGLAVSEDGIHFTREAKPVLFPADDAQKDREWPGGCEDPRLVEGPDGTYYMLYTQYARPKIRLGLASSKDLRAWTKHGSPFAGTRYEDNVGVQYKSATIVQEVQNGRPVAVRIQGKYWMYFGESSVNLATSEDLIHWRPVEDQGGHPVTVMRPRQDCFDSGGLTEIGPLALLTSHGIVVFYNGKHTGRGPGKEIGLTPKAYAGGQALFDAADPSRLIERLALPFIQPKLDWEKTGQYASGTTFTEGLVLFRGQWFLYYGCADTFVGVAICDPTATAPK